MSAGEYAFQFVYPAATPTNDLRTVLVKQVVEGLESGIEFYKHPVTGSISGVTTFSRMNLETQRWETAGTVEWSSNHSAVVTFGIESISMRELRKPKKSSSQSRRFKAGGSEYKWKVTEDGLVCSGGSRGGKVVATWSQSTLTLRVAERIEPILDRVVVTCFLNIWMKSRNAW
ncbi:hypothetical protein BXZ70DRAFT_1004487 [Cristinia sonorae]|uniref:DUF6593 domain-containing protein n=1 Tax=Cristinia sonorae TaxID=1940300 RepID=A0A8K0UXE2_9AGAR|nr:hypothetical protein BXZ70DRAFT_1004487 [Cristinia sonorae]